MDSDLLFRSATELATLVRSGEVSAREVVTASLERIEALREPLNAFTQIDAERALATADATGTGDARPFAGVPIAVKDLLAPVAGLRLTQGSDFFQEYTPNYDSHMVRRLKDAGFIIVGRTNTPEFGIGPVTEPRRFGATRNPWDVERTPGGSSGGSGAAVAAGMVPLAHGSDGGGSIRIPASCCGLVGLKASRGRISHGPDLGESFLISDGVLTHTVADTAAVLDVLAGYELGDSTWAPPPTESFTEAAYRTPRRLRIAVTSVPPLETAVDSACVASARAAGELLASLGHDVEEIDPPWVRPELFGTFTAVCGMLAGMVMAMGTKVAGRTPTRTDVEPLTWELYCQGTRLDSIAYVEALTELQAYSRSVVCFFSKWDVVVTPTLARRPARIGEIDGCADDPMSEWAKLPGFNSFTSTFNFTGQPAISLPLFHGADGLPLGVQLVGPPNGDELLLSLAAQVEAAAPWADRRPEPQRSEPQRG